ncbi:MAG: GspMb/PilO family protein [Acidobacteriota bacterium]
MSEPVTVKPENRRAQVSARIQRLRTTRRQGMLGVPEIIGLGMSALILFVVVVSYVYFLVPARSRLQGLELERARLQSQLRSSQELMRQGHDTQSTVDKITESLEGFEENRLPNHSQGRMGLYGELNQLIRKNGVRNTSGPAYTPLLSSTVKASTVGARSASAKWQSVYPGIAVSVTAEGPYQNLRHFIRDLEASKQFIIINAIELERATETNSASAAQGDAAGGARASLVSLRLDMATYFKLGGTGTPTVDAVGH